MPLSPFRSSTSALLLLAAIAGGGCSDDGDDACGPASGLPGISLTVGGETVTYGAFSASENNDCTLQASGVISVSVHGTQTGGASPFTLCLPRPDLLGADPVALVPSRVPPMDGDRAMVIDSSAALAAGCTVEKDVSMAPSGNARFLGYCDGGTNGAGYALEVAGTVPLLRTCAGGPAEHVMGTLAGSVAVDVP